MTQATFDFTPPKEIVVHTRENNCFSESILEENRERLSKQCKYIRDLLLSGIFLTTLKAAVEYGITSLPRRLLDLEQFYSRKNGFDYDFEIPERKIEFKGGKRKEWFMTQEDAKEFREKFLK